MHASSSEDRAQAIPGRKQGKLHGGYTVCKKSRMSDAHAAECVGHSAADRGNSRCKAQRPENDGWGLLRSMGQGVDRRRLGTDTAGH